MAAILLSTYKLLTAIALLAIATIDRFIMGPVLFPTNPPQVMVIRNVTEDVVTMSLPFARFGHLKFGGRGTLGSYPNGTIHSVFTYLSATVRMATGSVAVFSPVTLTPEVREAVNSLGGKVKYIAALDMEHHIHLTSWKKAYPDAEVIGPEGLWEKRQSNPEYKDTPFHHIFTKEKSSTGPQKISEEFDSEFETEYIHGHGSRELVFMHKPSRTLIEADLLFNLPAREQYSRTNEDANRGILTKLVNPLLSTSPPATWQKRFAWYILSARDRNAFRKSVQRIDTWEFNRLIPCHGDVIESGAKGVFRTVMEWFLHDPKKDI